jgi:hypothetical protein
MLGDTVDEKEVVNNYLRVVPEKYEQVAVVIETMLDLKTISIEVTGRLTAAEDHAPRRVAARVVRMTAISALLFTHDEWIARTIRMTGSDPPARAQQGVEELQVATGQRSVPTVRHDMALGKGVLDPAQDAQGLGEFSGGR